MQDYEEINDYIKVKLTNCDEYMLCDIDDWNWLKQYRWHKYNGYARARLTNNKGKRQNIFFHRQIIECPRGMVRDHINRNRLDNRKSNIRITSQQVNVINRGNQVNNTSGYPGVYWDKSNNKWRAAIWVNYKRIYLGSFDNLKDAIYAKKNAERKYHIPLLNN